MNVEFGARSDTGRARENNEDSFASAPELNLFVLSDGMGGLAAGEVASKLACDTIIRRCRDAESNPALPVVGEHLPGLSVDFKPSGQRDSRGKPRGLRGGAKQRTKARHGRNGRSCMVRGRTTRKRRARRR